MPAPGACRRRRDDALTRRGLDVRPVQTWTRFDVGLAAVALPFLAFGLWGVISVAGTLNDVSALDHDCRVRDCFHHGVLVEHQPGVIPRSGTYIPGPATNYCVLTMRLDNGTWQAAVNGSYCLGLANGTQVDAEIWRSQGRRCQVVTRPDRHVRESRGRDSGGHRASARAGSSRSADRDDPLRRCEPARCPKAAAATRRRVALPT